MTKQPYTPTPPDTLSGYVFGKAMPHAPDLEQVVLGAALLEREATGTVTDTLTASAFYLDAHKIIYEAIVELTRKSNPVDLLTVVEQLRTTGGLEKVGGAYVVTELMQRVASTANLEYHCRILRQFQIRREVIQAGTAAIEGGYNDALDPFDHLDATERNLFEITNKGASGQITTARASLTDFFTGLDAAMKSGSGITGVPSHIRSIDKMSAGWQPSDLIILAGRPGMGKTAAALSKALFQAMAGVPVAFFSLEMSKLQLVSRLVSMVSGVDSELIKNGTLNPQQMQSVQDAAEVIRTLNIYIDDSPGLTVMQFRNRLRRLVLKHGVKMAYLDYIQLMEGGEKNRNREQEISGISRAVKITAKELNVPIMALSQLSRALETRGGAKRPQLSDLRESGSLEQDADVVAFVFRPEYYGILEDDSGMSTNGLAEFIFAKHRNGKLGTAICHFDAPRTMYTDVQNGGAVFTQTTSTTTFERRPADEYTPF
jgi:replicative DNA helicase